MKYDRAIEAAAEAMGIPSDQIATDLIDGIHAAAPFLKADAWDEGYRSCDEVWKQILEGGWDRPERDDDVPEIDYTKNPYREESPDA